MGITITKTIREEARGRFPHSGSPTGWGRTEHVRNDRGVTKDRVVVPAPAPMVVPYVEGESEESRGFRGGNIHTAIDVDGPLRLDLTAREAEVVLAALLSSKMFTKGMYGNEPTPEQKERAFHIERVFMKAGVPDDFILRDR